MNDRRTTMLAALILFGVVAPGTASFTSTWKTEFNASAAVLAGSTATIKITALTLPGQAFFGKNVLIPVQVTNTSGPINPKNVTVAIVFQLRDASGTSPLGPATQLSFPLTPDPTDSHSLRGTASIPAANLQGIQHGGQLTYLFVATQGGAGTMRNGAGQAPAPSNIAASQDLNVYAPFNTAITDHFCNPVSPAGARVSAADLSINDGQTAVSLSPGVVSAPGTLCIKAEDTSAWPKGPSGASAVAVYTITLQNTSLTGLAQLILSYPSDISGKVLGLNADAGSLGMYWLDSSNGAFPSGNWRPLSRSSLDSTLHTLSGMSGHFSTFGLFATGAIGSADLRPAERIITPNGDGINDTATFGSGIDEVRLFDVRGRRVRTLTGPAIVWDGKDDDGKTVESGVYIYQYTSQGDRVSGVIGVAK